MSQYLNPRQLEHRPLQEIKKSMEIGSDDIMGEAGGERSRRRDTGEAKNLTQLHRDAWKLLKDLIL